MIELRLPVRVVDRSRTNDAGGPWQLRDATFRWLCGGGRDDMEAIAAALNESATLRARLARVENAAREAVTMIRGKRAPIGTDTIPGTAIHRRYTITIDPGGAAALLEEALGEGGA